MLHCKLVLAFGDIMLILQIERASATPLLPKTSGLTNLSGTCHEKIGLAG